MTSTPTVMAALLSCLALPVLAQVSLDDLDRAMNARSDEMTAFRERLNDPDPNRAMTAMQLLIAKGDTQQRQMAVDHGLGSTDPAIRLAAVTAILDAGPILVGRWRPVNGELPKSNNFTNSVRRLDGTIEPDKTVRVPLPVGKRSEESNCWLLKDEKPCLFRINQSEISHQIAGAWVQLRFDDKERLVGTAVMDGTRFNIEISIAR